MAYSRLEYEKRTRELLEDGDMRFRWDLYFPWYFLADLGIMACIVAVLVWLFR